MDLEKGFAKFESSAWPKRHPAGSKAALEPVASKDRANLGKVSRYGPHASSDDCPCRMCRRARMLERRSWEPLTLRDKVYCYGALGAGAGIFVLLGIAWLVSVTP